MSETLGDYLIKEENYLRRREVIGFQILVQSSSLTSWKAGGRPVKTQFLLHQPFLKKQGRGHFYWGAWQRDRVASAESRSTSQRGWASHYENSHQVIRIGRGFQARQATWVMPGSLHGTSIPRTPALGVPGVRGTEERGGDETGEEGRTRVLAWTLA